MIFTPMELPEVVLVEPRRFGDERGYFSETYKASTMAEHGLPTNFIQDNESFSATTGTVRGVHFQREPFAQAKLVRVITGSILDIAIDFRRASPTFGQVVSVELSAETGHQLFVPAGFGHAFCTLEPNTTITYKVNNNYSPESEGAVLWNDPKLGIPWPDVAGSVISDKDAAAPSLADNPVLFE
jgi:dTDP-4-dehydrorhamnose 3,5-epimerase